MKDKMAKSRLTVITLVALIVLGLALAVWSLLDPGTLGFAGISMELAILGATIGLGIALAVYHRAKYRNLEAHTVGDEDHRCQCLACGQTFSPTGAPTHPRAGNTPQEKTILRKALSRAGLGIVIVGIAIAAASYFSDPSPTVLAVSILLPLFVCGSVGIPASLAGMLPVPPAPEAHACSCRWCGAPGR